MTENKSLRLAFYGDDLTGSTDALEFLTRSGAHTILFIEPPTSEQLIRHPGLDAFGVAGMTRAMDPASMEATLRPAFATMRDLGPAHIHYKVCSTFDSSPTVGSIGRALDIGREVFDHARFAPILVGAPPLGRYCVFGNLFARMGIGSSGRIYRLDQHPSMSRHPVTPADESDLRLHLSRQTHRKVGLFDILDVDLPAAEADAALDQILATGVDAVLFDALRDDQLPGLGRLLDREAQPGAPVFSVGSSAVEMALGAYWSACGIWHPRTDFDDPGPAKPLLVASGSCSPVTAEQIEWALANGFASVALDTVGLARGEAPDSAIAAAVEAATSELKSGRSVVVHSSLGDRDERVAATMDAFRARGLDQASVRGVTAELFGTALGATVREVVANTGIRRILLAGGDSSSFAARALEIEAVEMIAPLAPGAPLCRAFAPGSPADGIEINFKGGQVGVADYFGSVADGWIPEGRGGGNRQR